LTVIPSKTYSGRISNISLKFNAANVKSKNDLLIANTGVIERCWKWMGKGFVAVSLQQLDSGRQWANTNTEYLCDWSLQGFIDKSSEAKLTKLTAEKSDDNGFTTEHIKVVAENKYPKRKLALQYVIWVYPNSPGIRIQHRVKALDGFKAGSKSNIAGCVDFINILPGNLKRRAIGYYNHTQLRNFHETKILREEVFLQNKRSEIAPHR